MEVIIIIALVLIIKMANEQEIKKHETDNKPLQRKMIFIEFQRFFRRRPEWPAFKLYPMLLKAALGLEVPAADQ